MYWPSYVWFEEDEDRVHWIAYGRWGWMRSAAPDLEAAKRQAVYAPMLMRAVVQRGLGDSQEHDQNA